MGRRLMLNALLLTIADHVYFQPPESVKMKYPCIVYRHSANSTIYAEDEPYNVKKQYTITIIDRDPDSDIPDRIARLPMTRMDTSYTAENLNHWIFTMYY